jgi:hypothetical protein
MAIKRAVTKWQKKSRQNRENIYESTPGPEAAAVGDTASSSLGSTHSDLLICGPQDRNLQQWFCSETSDRLDSLAKLQLRTSDQLDSPEPLKKPVALVRTDKISHKKKRKGGWGDDFRSAPFLVEWSMGHAVSFVVFRAADRGIILVGSIYEDSKNKK